MVARLNVTEIEARLTAENHPENAVEAPPPTSKGLGASVALGIVCGLVGMVLGSAALSTSFAADKPDELFSVVLLIATAVAIVTGWAGAFAWMIRSDPAHHES